VPDGDFSLNCPIPLSDYPHVLLAHGGGGRLMNDLIERMFGPAFANPLLDERHDGAVFSAPQGRLAFTTDSYVVHPLFFPGGDIGILAVNGTVNDLAMCGARPLHLAAAFIIEEGLPMETLWRVTESMRKAAREAGVAIVTGDTKVVDRGKGDGLFVTTAGIGVVEHGLKIAPGSVREGDAVVLSGDIGRHGMAVMAVREGLSFESAIESDCAPLAAVTGALVSDGLSLHCLRDLTRGGLASALVEIAQGARLRVNVRETAVPVREDVRAACEILGLDPLYVANEGRFVCFLPAAEADRALSIIRGFPVGKGAAVIGHVAAANSDSPKMTPCVIMTTAVGTERIVDMFSGEQLPRIC